MKNKKKMIFLKKASQFCLTFSQEGVYYRIET